MKNFKVSQLWCITSFSQHFETCFNKVCQTTHKNCLFTKQIFFSFFFKCCYKQADTCSTDTFSPVHCNVLSISCWILVNSVKSWYTKSFCICTTYQVTWSFRSNHEDINIFWSFNVAKVNIKSMGKTKSFTCTQVWRNFIFIDVFLNFIWCQNHNDISQFSCFCYCVSIKTIFFSFIK